MTSPFVIISLDQEQEREAENARLAAEAQAAKDLAAKLAVRSARDRRHKHWASMVAFACVLWVLFVRL